MNRRDVLRLGGASMVAALAGSQRDTAAAQGGGPFTITMHGPGLLHFPRGGNPASADLHFTAFPSDPDPTCVMPIHLPHLSIDKTAVSCVGHPGDHWMVANYAIEPEMTSPFTAVEHDRDAAPNAQQPHAHPANAADWRSLRWVPRLDGVVDTRVLTEATTAIVRMKSGELAAGPADYPEARSAMWIWKTADEWTRLSQSSWSTTPQQYMTDVIVLSGRYSGEAATIRLVSLLDPAAVVTLTFRPMQAGGPVDVVISAEQPDDGKAADPRPLKLYCAYYQVVNVDGPNRRLPYLSPSTFSVAPAQLVDLERRLELFSRRPFAPKSHLMKNPARKPLDDLAQLTPRPLCGSFRIFF